MCLLGNLIVQCSQFADLVDFWRNGAVFRIKKNVILLELIPLSNRLYFGTIKSENPKNTLKESIQRFRPLVNEKIGNTVLLPCPFTADSDFIIDYDRLSKKTIICKKCYEDHTFSSLFGEGEKKETGNFN